MSEAKKYLLVKHPVADAAAAKQRAKAMGLRVLDPAVASEADLALGVAMDEPKAGKKAAKTEGVEQ